MAVRRVTNDNTIRYVRACFICAVACIVIGAVLLLCLNMFNHTEALRWRPYVVGGMSGALGALLSIVTRVQAFELKPCYESRMNYWMSTIRIITGVVSAIALLLFADTLLADMLHKLTGIQHITDPIDVNATDLVIWQAVAVLGFVAGFAERLIPILLRQTADKIESTVGTPVQAARAQEALPVQQTERVAAL
jgi:cellobiose-specific phosphotransferase system component IIC